MNLHDTHFHLDLMKNPKAAINQIERLGVYTIAVTNLPSVFFHTQQLADGCRFVRPALGLHPELVARHPGEIDKFRELIGETRYIGEVGLDNQFKTKNDYSAQKKAFELILKCCADDQSKVLTIHSRRAEQEVLTMIDDGFSCKFILHWFSGSLKIMETALQRGIYFSVNYAMTQSLNGKKIIEKLPLTHILLESDGPFTIYDGQVCGPQHVSLIAEQIATIKGYNDAEVVSTQLCANFAKIIKES